MEVVCLILGPMLTSQPCSHAFWVLTSLHLPSFLLKMFLLFLCTKSSTGNRIISTNYFQTHTTVLRSYIINRQNVVLSCNSLSDIYNIHALNDIVTPMRTLGKILLIKAYHSISRIIEIAQTKFGIYNSAGLAT